MMLSGLVLHTATSYATLPIGDAWPFKDPNPSATFNRILVGAHSFRMQVFMVMAGFFAALLIERRGPRSFADNRRQRVLAPFVLGYLLLVPVIRWEFAFAQAVVAGTPSPLSAGLRDAVNPVFRDLTSPLWFLYYLLIFYVVTLSLRALSPKALGSRSRVAFARAMKLPLGLGVLPLILVGGLLCSTMPCGWLGGSFGFLPAARSSRTTCSSGSATFCTGRENSSTGCAAACSGRRRSRWYFSSLTWRGARRA